MEVLFQIWGCIHTSAFFCDLMFSNHSSCGNGCFCSGVMFIHIYFTKIKNGKVWVGGRGRRRSELSSLNVWLVTCCSRPVYALRLRINAWVRCVFLTQLLKHEPQFSIRDCSQMNMFILRTSKLWAVSIHYKFRLKVEFLLGQSGNAANYTD